MDSEAEKLFLETVAKTRVTDKDTAKTQTKKVQTVSSLDLHGFRADSAKTRLLSWLASKERAAGSELRVIAGRGTHSPGISSPLRDMVSTTLSEEAALGKLQFREDNGVFYIWISKKHSS